MAITKLPARVQPAFNEVVVTDDTATSLQVSSVAPSPVETVTLYHVNASNGADFDLKGFLSKLFYDGRTPIPTSDFAPWAFRDQRLAVNYRIAGNDERYLALNAVRQVGETLDMYNEIAPPVLSDRAKLNQTSITIPCYDGFPVGFSALFRKEYELDISDAFIVTLQAVAGTTYAFPVIGNGLIFWGDGAVEASHTTTYRTHVYANSGLMTLYFVPLSAGAKHDPAQNAESTDGTATYRAAIRTVEQFSSKMSTVRFIQHTGLTAVSGVWRATDCTPAAMFYGCTNLVSVPANFFDSVTSTTLKSWSSMFYGCSKLQAIPTGFFKRAVNVDSYIGCFQGCSSIQSVPSGMLPISANPTLQVSSMFLLCTGLTSIAADLFTANGPKIPNFTSVFQNCTSLTSIPAALFQTATSATSFTYTFQLCSALTVIPADLFRYCTAVDSFNNTFYGCKNVTVVPATLFAHNVNVTSFNSTFAECTGVTAIPATLFNSNTKVTTVAYCFRACGLAGASAIPAALFKYNPLIQNFTYTFWGAFNVTSIPGDLFSYSTANNININYAVAGMTSVTSIPTGLLASSRITSALYLFQEWSITSIPTDLFAAYAGTGVTPDCTGMFSRAKISAIPPGLLQTLVNATTQFNSMFEQTPITAIPSGLFQYNTKLTNVGAMFYGCVGLTSIPGDLFDPCPDLENVSILFGAAAAQNAPIPSNFLAQNKKLNNCSFAWQSNQSVGPTGSTPVTPEGYKLWERAGKPGYPATINGDSCFRGRTQLSDYASIPSAWRS